MKEYYHQKRGKHQWFEHIYLKDQDKITKLWVNYGCGSWEYFENPKFKCSSFASLVSEDWVYKTLFLDSL